MPHLRNIFARSNKCGIAACFEDQVSERDEERIAAIKKSISSPLKSTLRTSYAGSTRSLALPAANAKCQEDAAQALGQLAPPFRWGYSLRPEAPQVRGRADQEIGGEGVEFQEEISWLRNSLVEDGIVRRGRSVASSHSLPRRVAGEPWMKGEYEMESEFLEFAAPLGRSPSPLVARRLDPTYGSRPPRSGYGLVVNEAALASRMVPRSAVDGGYPFRTDSLFAPHSRAAAPSPSGHRSAASGNRWPFSKQPEVPSQRSASEGSLKNSPSLEVLLRLNGAASEVARKEQARQQSIDSQMQRASAASSGYEIIWKDALEFQEPVTFTGDYDDQVAKSSTISQEDLSEDLANIQRELRGFENSLASTRPLAESLMLRMRQYLTKVSVSDEIAASFATAYHELEKLLESLEAHRIKLRNVTPNDDGFRETAALLLAQHNLFQKELQNTRRIYRSLMKTFEDHLHEQTSALRTCMICADDKPLPSFPSGPPTKTCNHKPDTCTPCLQTWLASELSSKGPTTTFTCPQCPSELSHNDLQNSASEETFRTYDTLTTRAALSLDPNFAWCLRPGCSSGQLNPPPEKVSHRNHMRCIECGYEACLHHNTAWHRGESCIAFDRRNNKHQKDARKTAAMLDSVSKLCPNPSCGWRIQKITGCDAMKCSRCAQKFCWQCLVPQDMIARFGARAHGRGCKYFEANVTEVGWPFNVHLDHQ